MSDLYFVDQSHGWILTGVGPGQPVPQCFRTDDGGETWQPSDMLVGEPSRVRFRNPDDGWMIATGERTGPHRFAFTIDTGGRTETAYLGGERNWICRTSDGGRSWTPVSWLDHDLTDVAVEPAPSHRIFLSGFDGLLLLSTDEGETWRPIKTGFEGEICRPVIKNDTIVAPGGVPGAGAIIVSLNKGVNWAVFPLDDVPFAAHLRDDRSGVIAACAGVYDFELLSK